MAVPPFEQFLENQVTVMTVAELIEATAYGHLDAMGALPPAPCLAVEVAQECLESGNGEHLYCYGVGNVKWSPDWGGLFTYRRCSEVVGGKVEWFDPPADPRAAVERDAACAFRAFLSGREGCRAQVEFLATRDRYRKAWGLIYAGRADAAVRELAHAGYFTANVDAYARAVMLIYGHLLGPCAQFLEDRTGAVDSQTASRVRDLVLGSLYDPALRDLRLHEDLAA